MKLTKKDMGCWIDGAYGLDRTRNKLASLIEMYSHKPNEHTDLINSLNNHVELFDDDFSTMDSAVEILQTICEEDVEFFWIDGDLILSTCELIGEY